MLLALLIWRLRKDGSRFKFWSVLMLWVLFFPNAFYLVTDLIHMKKFGLDGIYRWFDLMMTTSFASTGVFLGCLSLYLLHLFVRQRHGWKAGWLFASGMLALGLTVYVPRFAPRTMMPFDFFGFEKVARRWLT